MKGFTLIEMLIVVAIIAILAAIAIPAYGDYVDRGKIKVAQSDLVALGLNLENEYRKRLSYIGTTTTYATAGDIKTGFPKWSWAPASDHFTYSATIQPGGYTISASGNSGKIASCTVSLTNTGDKQINTSCPYADGGSWL